MGSWPAELRMAEIPVGGGSDLPTRFGASHTAARERPAMSDLTVSFDFDQQPLRFRSVSENDHILKVMRELGTFYEYDVLLRMRERLRAGKRTGSAIDAGGFIGTHTVFLSKLCGLSPVMTFEANPSTYAVLGENLESNGVSPGVIAVNKALGAAPGHAEMVLGPEGNRGSTQVATGAGGSIPLTTIDAETEARGLKDVCAIKIDVEGMELEVLRGAAGVIAAQTPVLCVEVHNPQNLRQVLGLLGPSRYWIVDCLGYSPTYIIEPTRASERRRRLVNAIWLQRAKLPQSRSFLRKRLRRLAQRLSTGRWEPPSAPNKK